MKCRVHELLYPEKFNDGKIMAVQEVSSELYYILEKSGQKDLYIRSLRQRYKFLVNRMHECIIKSDWFESLKNEKDLYVLKVKGIINLRIVFCFVQNENRTMIIFLYAFQEKSKSDYTVPKQIARKRMEDLR